MAIPPHTTSTSARRAFTSASTPASTSSTIPISTPASASTSLYPLLTPPSRGPSSRPRKRTNSGGKTAPGLASAAASTSPGVPLRPPPPLPPSFDPQLSVNSTTASTSPLTPIQISSEPVKRKSVKKRPPTPGAPGTLKAGTTSGSGRRFHRKNGSVGSLSDGNGGGSERGYGGGSELGHGGSERGHGGGLSGSERGHGDGDEERTPRVLTSATARPLPLSAPIPKQKKKWRPPTPGAHAASPSRTFKPSLSGVSSHTSTPAPRPRLAVQVAAKEGESDADGGNRESVFSLSAFPTPPALTTPIPLPPIAELLRTTAQTLPAALTTPRTTAVTRSPSSSSSATTKKPTIKSKANVNDNNDQPEVVKTPAADEDGDGEGEEESSLAGTQTPAQTLTKKGLVQDPPAQPRAQDPSTNIPIAHSVSSSSTPTATTPSLTPSSSTDNMGLFKALARSASATAVAVTGSGAERDAAGRPESRGKSDALRPGSATVRPASSGKNAAGSLGRIRQVAPAPLTLTKAKSFSNLKAQEASSPVRTTPLNGSPASGSGSGSASGAGGGDKGGGSGIKRLLSKPRTPTSPSFLSGFGVGSKGANVRDKRGGDSAPNSATSATFSAAGAFSTVAGLGRVSGSGSESESAIRNQRRHSHRPRPPIPGGIDGPRRKDLAEMLGSEVQAEMVRMRVERAREERESKERESRERGMERDKGSTSEPDQHLSYTSSPKRDRGSSPLASSTTHPNASKRPGLSHASSSTSASTQHHYNPVLVSASASTSGRSGIAAIESYGGPSAASTSTASQTSNPTANPSGLTSTTSTSLAASPPSLPRSPLSQSNFSSIHSIPAASASTPALQSTATSSTTTLPSSHPPSPRPAVPSAAPTSYNHPQPPKSFYTARSASDSGHGSYSTPTPPRAPYTSSAANASASTFASTSNHSHSYHNHSPYSQFHPRGSSSSAIAKPSNYGQQQPKLSPTVAFFPLSPVSGWVSDHGVAEKVPSPSPGPSSKGSGSGSGGGFRNVLKRRPSASVKSPTSNSASASEAAADPSAQGTVRSAVSARSFGISSFGTTASDRDKVVDSEKKREKRQKKEREMEAERKRKEMEKREKEAAKERARKDKEMEKEAERIDKERAKEYERREKEAKERAKEAERLEKERLKEKKRHQKAQRSFSLETPYAALGPGGLLVGSPVSGSMTSPIGGPGGVSGVANILGTLGPSDNRVKSAATAARVSYQLGALQSKVKVPNKDGLETWRNGVRTGSSSGSGGAAPSGFGYASSQMGSGYANSQMGHVQSGYFSDTRSMAKSQSGAASWHGHGQAYGDEYPMHAYLHNPVVSVTPHSPERERVRGRSYDKPSAEDYERFEYRQHQVKRQNHLQQQQQQSLSPIPGSVSPSPDPMNPLNARRSGSPSGASLNPLLSSSVGGLSRSTTLNTLMVSAGGSGRGLAYDDGTDSDELMRKEEERHRRREKKRAAAEAKEKDGIFSYDLNSPENSDQERSYDRHRRRYESDEDFDDMYDDDGRPKVVRRKNMFGYAFDGDRDEQGRMKHRNEERRRPHTAQPSLGSGSGSASPLGSEPDGMTVGRGRGNGRGGWDMAGWDPNRFTSGAGTTGSLLSAGSSPLTFAPVSLPPTRSTSRSEPDKERERRRQRQRGSTVSASTSHSLTPGEERRRRPATANGTVSSPSTSGSPMIFAVPLAGHTSPLSSRATSVAVDALGLNLVNSSGRGRGHTLSISTTQSKASALKGSRAASLARGERERDLEMERLSGLKNAKQARRRSSAALTPAASLVEAYKARALAPTLSDDDEEEVEVVASLPPPPHHTPDPRFEDRRGRPNLSLKVEISPSSSPSRQLSAVSAHNITTASITTAATTRSQQHFLSATSTPLATSVISPSANFLSVSPPGSGSGGSGVESRGGLNVESRAGSRTASPNPSSSGGYTHSTYSRASGRRAREDEPITQETDVSSKRDTLRKDIWSSDSEESVEELDEEDEADDYEGGEDDELDLGMSLAMANRRAEISRIRDAGLEFASSPGFSVDGARFAGWRESIDSNKEGMEDDEENGVEIIVGPEARRVETGFDAEGEMRGREAARERVVSDTDPSATPFFSVFGSPSGRVVAVGTGPEEIWDKSGWDSRSETKRDKKRKLETKEKSKSKKSKVPDTEKETEKEKSLSRKSSERSKPDGPSILRRGRDRSRDKSRDASRDRGDDDHKPDQRPKRLWNLMRRISSGSALRELVAAEAALTSQGSSASQTPLPPIPTIPVPASSATKKGRQSTTTRSSSPVSSSDVASSKFFHRTHSAKSSTSSLGSDVSHGAPSEPPPPMPRLDHRIERRIVHPSAIDAEEPRFADGKSDSSRGRQFPESITIPPRRSPSSMVLDQDWRLLKSPEQELPSLTLPPRRPHLAPGAVGASGSNHGTPGTSPTATKIHSSMDRAESPTLPSFSTNNAVNSFPSKRLSRSSASPISPSTSPPPASGVPPPLPMTSPTSTSNTVPPPRPKRSAQRPPPPSSSSSATSPVYLSPSQTDATAQSQTLFPPPSDDVASKIRQQYSSFSDAPNAHWFGSVNSSSSKRSRQRSLSSGGFAPRPGSAVSGRSSSPGGDGHNHGSLRRRSSSAGFSAAGVSHHDNRTSRPWSPPRTLGRTTSMATFGAVARSESGWSASRPSTARSEMSELSEAAETPIDRSPPDSASSSATANVGLKPRGGMFVFRQVGDKRKDSESGAPLSEDEKARRWDELLLKSDLAGGTLHLGGGGW